MSDFDRSDVPLRINISVEMNDEIIYEDWGSDMEDFEGNCLRKAEHAIEAKYVELEEEAEAEEEEDEEDEEDGGV